MTRRIISIMEGYRFMTSSECIARLQSTNGNRLGMIYTWSKQGVLRGKAFREVVEDIIERRAELMAKNMVRDMIDGVEESPEIVEENIDTGVA